MYRLRGTDDSLAVMPLDAAIAYGTRLLADESDVVEAVGPDGPERLGTVPPGSVS